MYCLAIKHQAALIFLQVLQNAEDHSSRGSSQVPFLSAAMSNRSFAPFFLNFEQFDLFFLLQTPFQAR
jgi:hypothetical protein